MIIKILSYIVCVVRTWRSDCARVPQWDAAPCVGRPLRWCMCWRAWGAAIDRCVGLQVCARALLSVCVCVCARECICLYVLAEVSPRGAEHQNWPCSGEKKKKKDDNLFIGVCTNFSPSSIRCRAPLSPLFSNCFFLSDCRLIDFLPKKGSPLQLSPGHGEMDAVIYDLNVVSHSIKARNVFSANIRTRPAALASQRVSSRPEAFQGHYKFVPLSDEVQLAMPNRWLCSLRGFH